MALARRAQGVARAQRRGELRQVDAVRAGLRKATRLEGVALTGWAWSWGVTRGPPGAEEKQKTPKAGLWERRKETERKLGLRARPKY